jgi:uncharacterized protein (TIGR03435 family)
MKRFALGLTALVLIFVSALFAQAPDITGTWQGILKAPNRDLRTVYEISKADDGGFKAVLYSIDQGARPISTNSVTVRGSAVRITIPAIGGTYDGTLSSDGNTIAGTWSQGAAPLPLILTRATPETTWTIPEPPPPPKMMDPNAKPEFEVASIKPTDPSRSGWGITVNSSGMLITHATTLNDLIKFAYDMHPRQVLGAPAWADSEKVDIEAKPDTPGMPNINQMKAMLQKLLADRFSLVFHKDKKELAVYAITVVKRGLKIQKEENAAVPIPGFGGQPRFGFNAHNATLAEFASVMQAQFMDLPVVDQTGLSDTRYTFMVKFTPDPGMRPFGGAFSPPAGSSPQADPDAPPDLFVAMEQQLGLHMQKTKAQAEVMIIDKVEHPSPN